jgi:hypothetical protein
MRECVIERVSVGGGGEGEAVLRLTQSQRSRRGRGRASVDEAGKEVVADLLLNVIVDCQFIHLNTTKCGAG